MIGARHVDGTVAALALVLGLGTASCGGGAANAHGSEAPPVDPVSDAEPEELFRTAEIHAARGDHVRAEQYLAAAGARGYPEAKVVKALVQVCVASSRLRQALAYGEPYLTRHPDDWRLRFVLAAVRLGLDDLDTALRELARVVDDAPNAPEPRYALGRLLHERRHAPDAARPHLEAYLRLAPDGLHAREVRALLEAPIDPLASRAAASPPDAGEGGSAPSPVRVVRVGEDAAESGAGEASPWSHGTSPTGARNGAGSVRSRAPGTLRPASRGPTSPASTAPAPAALGRPGRPRPSGGPS